MLLFPKLLDWSWMMLRRYVFNRVLVQGVRYSIFAESEGDALEQLGRDRARTEFVGLCACIFVPHRTKFQGLLLLRLSICLDIPFDARQVRT